MRRCTRYRRDGAACTNETEYHDGWCRQPDCAGFVRPSNTVAPESIGSPHGTRRHIGESGAVPVGDISSADVDDVHVTVRAIESFRFHHGGNARDAEAQLRGMLEDFLLKSARRESTRGFLQLSRQGYDLVLSPDRRAVTAYSTVHRERTWEQVKSGVRSRFRRQSSPNRPAMGPTIALPDFGTSFDPATIYLTKSAMTSFARVGGRTQATDAEIETALRGALRELPAERATQRDDGVFEIASGGDVWVISPDCRSLIVVVAGRSVPNCSTPSASDSPTPSR